MRKSVFVLFALALLAVLGLVFQEDGGRLAAKAQTLWSRNIGGAPDLQASYAFMIDAADGEVLYAKNEKKRAYPASTTKILTTLLALELGKPDEIVTVGQEADPEDPEESRAGLRRGQKLKLYDLVKAALLPSGNDAARTLGVHIGRKTAGNPAMSVGEAQEEFAKLMNKRAKKAGATNSHFVNPSGLHDPQHYSTARDLALIAKAAMANKLFREAVLATDSVVVSAPGGSGQTVKLTLANTNQLLQPGSSNYFPGATGIKTGFTDEAGYCLVSSAASDGKEVIAVVLQSTSKDVYPDARKLLELGLGSRTTAALKR
ncbi:D-alanyl-D-alanine carboxypeptidase family protein [Paenibacillus hodogayensis]|uniref:D-alanyl-D-alanine carboxypeptidase family protein n=1 Tax=Paenibacillus hodogayensis TaxID=279208 RepID=A0ABV5VWV6_9BACL